MAIDQYNCGFNDSIDVVIKTMEFLKRDLHKKEIDLNELISLLESIRKKV